MDAVTWNGRAAFAAKWARAIKKRRGLEKLLCNNDITCIQESHLAVRSLQSCNNLAHKFKCVVFGFAHGQLAGGTLVFVRRAFLEQHFHLAVWEELVPGRAGCLRCFGPKGNACFFNVHVYPCDPASCSGMFSVIAKSVKSNCFNMCMGDFNFVPKSDDRLYYDTDEYIKNTDVGVHNAWLEHFPDWTDISQATSLTQFGPEHAARLDRVYCPSIQLPQALVQIRSSIVPGFRDLSDHVPVRVQIHTKSASKSNNIPIHIIKHPLFVKHVRDTWSNCVTSHLDSWQKLKLLKSCMHVSCRHVRKHGKTSHEVAEHDLSLASIFFKAVCNDDSRLIETCINKNTKFKTCFKEMDGRCSLTSKFFEWWQECLSKGADTSDMAGSTPKRSMGGVAKVVSSFQPAKSGALDALWDNENSKPVFTRAEKTKLLEGHWGEVFDKKEVSEQAMEDIFAEYRTQFPQINWQLSRTYLGELLNNPKASCPGPDGIPFSAYKVLQDIVEPILWDCAQDLLNGGAAPDGFNFATLVLLPKKPSVQVEGEKWYAPKDTRPLSVTNADNRIIANLFRQVFAEFASKTCKIEQRGFLLNRFLIENVIDIDYEARKMYVQNSGGALVMVDLAAAFPSLSQDYLFKVLERQGVPSNFINAIHTFYKNNQQFIKVDGEVTPSFKVRSGVRQGCPLSPVLFALALDPFLNFLTIKLPQGTLIRAYADDMALVLPSRFLISDVVQAFAVLSRAAALKVNVGKTVFVPLYPTTMFQARKDIQSSHWADMKISIGCDKYLGFLVGPLATSDLNYEEPMRKFRERAAYWMAQRHLGSYFQCFGFNMCALSVFSFISQLYVMSATNLDEINNVALSFMLGPKAWFHGTGGHPYFRAALDLELKAVPRCPTAAMLAITYNTTIRFGFDLNSKLNILNNSISGDISYIPCLNLIQASPYRFQKDVWNLGDMPSIKGNITELTKETDMSKAVYRSFFNHFHPPGSVLSLFADRYGSRWCKADCLDSDQTEKLANVAVGNLKWLSKHVPPRVHMSNIRLHLNAWHTKMRYQQKENVECVFCGVDGTDDRLEHFFYCSKLRECRPKCFQHSPFIHMPVKYWFLLKLRKPDKIIMALYVHAVYTMHNTYRHILSKGELARSVERIMLDIPLRPALRRYVHGKINGALITEYDGPAL